MRMRIDVVGLTASVLAGCCVVFLILVGGPSRSRGVVSGRGVRRHTRDMGRSAVGEEGAP